MDLGAEGWSGEPLGAFRRRLVFFTGLQVDDFEGLRDLAQRCTKESAQQRIVQRGERTRAVYVMEAGVAARIRVTQDGGRQIVNFLVPGDLFDPMGLIHAQSDHSFETLTSIALAEIDAGRLFELFGTHRRLAAAFWWVAIQEEGMLREQIVRVGRRSAQHRTAHLLLELTWRLRLAGADVDNDEFWLPLSQAEVADALGLSHIHMNRVLRALRGEGYLEYGKRRIRVCADHRDDMSAFCDFDPAHLHLEAGVFASA